jgi:endonuclease YncB( thermonuclease family)
MLRTCLFFLLSLVLACRPGAQPYCTAESFDEIAMVRYVYDGDTLQLKDGRKVRLIGINTPELAHDDRSAKPFAGEAKKALEQLFTKDKTVALVYGEDKKDRYGRLLAHLFLADGNNVQAVLLRAGVANAINIPPNTSYASCYLEMENSARCNSKGLWKNSLILNAKNLRRQDAGFHMIRGRIDSIHTNRKGIWLDLDGQLTVGIRPDDLERFDIEEINHLINQVVIVRGWVNNSTRSTAFYLRLRHPLSLQPAATLPCPE